jgi:hypothetical protein
MALYRKSLDIWTLDHDARCKLQPGQWVTAGPNPDNRGIWCGVSHGGSCVAVWLGNLKGLKGQARLARIRQLMAYAKK